MKPAKTRPKLADEFEDYIPRILDPLLPLALAAVWPPCTRRESATLT